MSKPKNHVLLGSAAVIMAAVILGSGIQDISGVHQIRDQKEGDPTSYLDPPRQTAPPASQHDLVERLADVLLTILEIEEHNRMLDNKRSDLADEFIAFEAGYLAERGRLSDEYDGIAARGWNREQIAFTSDLINDVRDEYDERYAQFRQNDTRLATEYRYCADCLETVRGILNDSRGL